MNKLFVIRVYTSTKNKVKVISGFMDADELKTRTSGICYAVINSENKLGIFKTGEKAYQFSLVKDFSDQNIITDDVFTSIFIAEFLDKVFHSVDFTKDHDQFTIDLPYIETFRQTRVWVDKLDKPSYHRLDCWLFNYQIYLEDLSVYRLSLDEREEAVDYVDSWMPDLREQTINRLACDIYARIIIGKLTGDKLNSALIMLLTLLEKEELKC